MCTSVRLSCLFRATCQHQARERSRVQWFRIQDSSKILCVTTDCLPAMWRNTMVTASCMRGNIINNQQTRLVLWNGYGTINFHVIYELTIITQPDGAIMFGGHGMFCSPVIICSIHYLVYDGNNALGILLYNNCTQYLHLNAPVYRDPSLRPTPMPPPAPSLHSCNKTRPSPTSHLRHYFLFH